MVIGSSSSVLQSRNHRGRSSRTVTAVKSIWPAAMVPVSRLRTFATEASTVRMVPTKPGAVRNHEFSKLDPVLKYHKMCHSKC